MFDIPPVTYEASPLIVHERIVLSHQENPIQLWNTSLSSIAQNHLETMSEDELDADWRLNDLFGTIAVINLPSAEKRFQLIKNELESVGIHTFELVSAVDGRKDLPPSIWQKLINGDTEFETGKAQGHAGAYMSHYKLIRQTKQSFDEARQRLKQAVDAGDETATAIADDEVRRFSRILILEDDSGFGFLDHSKVSKENAGVLLRKALIDLPDDWDLFYLVVNATEPTTKHSEYLRKLKRSWSTSAYAVNYPMYGPLIDYLSKIEDPDVAHVRPIDDEMGELQRGYNTYAIYPSIVFTQGGKSLITGRTWFPWQGQPIYPAPAETKGLLTSPRVIVTLGTKCNFSAKDLKKNVDAVILSGKRVDLQNKIIKQDRVGYNHVIILDNAFSGMESYVKKLGFVHLHLNDTYENSLDLLRETLEVTPKSEEDLPHNDPFVVGRFYDLVSKTCQVLNANNITHWATCGTLLGMIRHKGMIPWDDDIDLAIFEENLPDLLALEDTLNRLGLGLAFHSKYDFYKIFPLDGEPICKENGEILPWKFPFIDIFPLRKRDGKYSYTGKIWYNGFKDRDFYTTDQLKFPLEEMEFGPLKIRVPHAPETYLQRLYGTDWNDVAYMTMSHRYDVLLTKIKVDLVNRLSPDYILPHDNRSTDDRIP